MSTPIRRHALALRRARRERPRDRAAEQRDKLTASIKKTKNHEGTLKNSSRQVATNLTR